MVHGSHPPPMLCQEGTNFLLWLYIDDFGAMSVDPRDQEAESTAVILRGRLSAELRRLGFVVHKEEEGEEITAIGLSVGGPRREARPEAEGFLRLLAETEALLELPTGSAQ